MLLWSSRSKLFEANGVIIVSLLCANRDVNKRLHSVRTTKESSLRREEKGGNPRGYELDLWWASGLKRLPISGGPRIIQTNKANPPVAPPVANVAFQ